jgi:hypothetical protein
MSADTDTAPRPAGKPQAAEPHPSPDNNLN